MAANDPFPEHAPARRVATHVATTIFAALALLAALAAPAHADAIRDKQWHLGFLEADRLHDMTRGKGVRVAVIDSGVDDDHPDLEGNVLKGKDFTGRGGAREDTNGHGTAMASLIAGHGHGPGDRDGVLGLAPGATVLPVRDHNTKKDASQRITDEAIDWAVEQDVEIMNLSFGGAGSYSAIENALNNDVVVVAAAGNTEQGDYGIGPPAAYPGVIAVSGVDRNGDFSRKSARGTEVVLAAPMVDLTAAGSGKRGTYATATGTSGATAIVSGVAALIRAKYPDLSANGVINRLIKTADDKGPPGRDDKYGFGVINPLQALTAQVPDIDHNPLIEGTGPSPSAQESTAHPKADSDDPTDTSLLLPGIALTATLLIVASMAVYFLTLARRRRAAAARSRHAPRPPPPTAVTRSAVPSVAQPTGEPPHVRHEPRQGSAPDP